MKYIAVFDIPDGHLYGSAIVKHCPNDGKVRCDAEHETAWATLERMDEFNSPRYLEVSFYRGLVLDHMEAAGMGLDMPHKLREKEGTKKAVLDVMRTPNMVGAKMRRAFYLGQLALLDFISELQNTYVFPQGGKHGDENKD